jgi:hypothetical protein
VTYVSHQGEHARTHTHTHTHARTRTRRRSSGGGSCTASSRRIQVRSAGSSRRRRRPRMPVTIVPPPAATVPSAGSRRYRCYSMSSHASDLWLAHVHNILSAAPNWIRAPSFVHGLGSGADRGARRAVPSMRRPSSESAGRAVRVSAAERTVEGRPGQTRTRRVSGRATDEASDLAAAHHLTRWSGDRRAVHDGHPPLCHQYSTAIPTRTAPRPGPAGPAAKSVTSSRQRDRRDRGTGPRRYPRSP